MPPQIFTKFLIIGNLPTIFVNYDLIPIAQNVFINYKTSSMLEAFAHSIASK